MAELDQYSDNKKAVIRRLVGSLLGRGKWIDEDEVIEDGKSDVDERT